MNKTYEERVQPTTEPTIGSLVLVRDNSDKVWALGRFLAIHPVAAFPYDVGTNHFKYALPYNTMTMNLEGTNNMPYAFKKGDAVLCRDREDKEWEPHVFSHMQMGSTYTFRVYKGTNTIEFIHCIPFDVYKVGKI